jgi:hypothetical protein
MSKVSTSSLFEGTRWPAVRRSLGLAAVLLATAASPAIAADAAERKFIREGMGEGEVILKLGKPDHEAFIRVVRGEPEEKTWTYFPHPRDAQTLTILSFKAGVVARIDRKIVR